MKKTWIKIAIVLVGCACIAGGYCYSAQATENNPTSTVASSVKENNQLQTGNAGENKKVDAKKDANVNLNKISQNNNTNTNTNVNSSNTQQNSNKNQVSSNNNTNNTSYNQTKNTSSSQAISNTQNSNSVATNNTQSNSSGATNNTQSNSNNAVTSNTQNNNNSGFIKVIPPEPKNNMAFPLSTVVVENTTGQPISNSTLNSVMRNWILKWQFNRQQACVATCEDWDPLWLSAIPDSALINAFIKANGKEALSENITAGEINKGARLYTDETYEKTLPFPFSTAQAIKYIQQMLNNDSKYYGTNTIEKVVLHPGPNDTAGLYYVYTKQMLAKGYKRPFWYVYTNTGQATGV